MQHQLDINTINKAAPPSYSEVMGYATAPPISETQTQSGSHAQPHNSSYNPSYNPSYYSQSYGAPPYETQTPFPASNYQNQNNPSSTPANAANSTHPSHISGIPGSQYSQQMYPPTVSHYVVNTQVVGHRKTFRERCCKPKFFVSFTFAFLIVYIIKVIIIRLMRDR